MRSKARLGGRRESQSFATAESHILTAYSRLPPSTCAYAQHPYVLTPSNATSASLTLYALPTLLKSPSVVPCNFTEDSSAPRRRLAAGGATQQLPGMQPAVSRWQAASPPSRHGCRTPRVPPAAHSNTVRPPQRVSWCQDVRIPTVPWSPCPRPRLRQRPHVQGRPVQCPVRVQRPRVRCPMSGVQCPRVWRLMSGVRVRCPVRASGSVSTLSAPVSPWSAWVRQAATRLGTGRIR
jgi:hypothetical protein